MPAPKTEVVRLEKLSKHYVEGGQLRPILDAADATFCTGELVAIRGRSGTGKSTLLNLIAGIDEP
ncbi:MAG: ATP-binding cassette domain-containing protein, partial [Chloroflexi bacterium]